MLHRGPPRRHRPGDPGGALGGALRPAGERLANLLIIGAVWRFATGVTRGLSPEADQSSRPGHRLYGLERYG